MAGALVLLATALLPLLPVDEWWIRIGDFPRVQLLFGYLIAISALTLFWHKPPAKLLAGGLVAGSAVQLFWIFPYLPIAPLEVESARSKEPDARLRILTANVLQVNRNAQPLLDLIEAEHPDVVVLCEVNDRWIHDVAELEDRFRFHLTHPLENGYGIAMYSQLEVTDARVRFLVSNEIPSIDARITLRSGKPVRIFALHPNPPRPGEDTTKRDGELVIAGRELQGEPTAIALGDLNDVGWSRTTNLFQEVSGLLDPRKGRGLFPTFNANSLIWRYPLDYLFHSDDFRLAEIRTLSHIGSDHFPLLVELSHEPVARYSQEAPDLDAGDREDADDAARDARRHMRENDPQNAASLGQRLR